jgi:hypothetical protein
MAVQVVSAEQETLFLHKHIVPENGTTLLKAQSAVGLLS